MIVEVRFDCDPHDVPQEVALDLIRAFPDEQVSVGLGYGGKAAAVVLDVHDADAPDLAEKVADAARELGLTVTVVETLTEDEYEARALAEDLG